MAAEPGDSWSAQPMALLGPGSSSGFAPGIRSQSVFPPLHGQHNPLAVLQQQVPNFCPSSCSCHGMLVARGKAPVPSSLQGIHVGNSHSSQQPWTTPDNLQHQEFCHRFPKSVNFSKWCSIWSLEDCSHFSFFLLVSGYSRFV